MDNVMSLSRISWMLFGFALSGSIGLADETATQPAEAAPTSTQSSETVTIFGFDASRIAEKGVDWQWPIKSLPLISIRHGQSRDGQTDTRIATGVIAIGDIAIGVVAIGGISVGVVSLGAVGLGVLGFGGVALSWLFALGGVAYARRISIGAVALGGISIGAVAIGRTAFGIVAIGPRGFGIIPLTGTFLRLFTGGR